MSQRLARLAFVCTFVLVGLGCGGGEGSSGGGPDASPTGADAAGAQPPDEVEDAGQEPVVDAPVIASFTVAKSKVSAGTPATLTAVFSGGAGTIDNGVGPVTSGAEITTAALTADTTFTLTVTSTTGESVTATVSVAVVAAPVITSFTADSTKVSRYTATNLNPVFTGGVASIDQGLGAVASGAPVSTGNLAAGKTYTLTVTNDANDSVTASVVVDVKRELFVTSYLNRSIAVFDEDATGDVAPKRRIVGASTHLTTNVGLHVAGDGLVVASGDRVLTFNLTDDGDVAPKREIVGAGAGLASAYGLVVKNDEIYVGNYGGAKVSVFDLADTGDVAPKRAISGASTMLTDPVGVWIDSDELYSANFEGGKLTVHDVAAVDDTAPKRSVSISHPIGVVVSGAEAIVGGQSAITIFDKTTLTQLRKITGASTTIGAIWQCVVVEAELACTNYSGGAVNSILFFPIAGDGDIAPSHALSGASTLLSGPTGIVLH